VNAGAQLSTKNEWSQPQPGNYPGEMEITREGPWCQRCNIKHTDRIIRRQGIYTRTIGPHWLGYFQSAEEAKNHEYEKSD
jgi:hypothetical protein